MCKLMKCWIILALGEQTDICSMCVCVRVCGYVCVLESEG